jgi:hypothetical protein
LRLQAVMDMLGAFLRPCLTSIRELFLRRWDWRTCWRSADFWLAVATLVLPFGCVLLVFQYEPVRARLRSGR